MTSAVGRDRRDDPDQDLIDRLGRGEPEAARAMVSRKLPPLLGLATRMLGDPAEAEDVAQESFVRIWQQAPRWKPGTARFDTWLHRVVLNLCYDRLRRRRVLPQESLPDPIDPAPLPDVRMAADDMESRVRAALMALPDRQREAIILQYYQDLSNIEAAAAMAISVDALESLLARGRRALRLMLKDATDDA